MANQINKEGINTGIGWCHYTANLWWGCTKVHAGCDFCYVESWANRFGTDVWGYDKPRQEVKSVWKDLDKYQRLASRAGEVHRVFVGSMMDIFEKPMMLVDSKGVELMQGTGELRFKFFSAIEAGNYPNLMFLLLTKRPSNINKYIPESWKTNLPKNVMFGTSPVDQDTASTLIYQLLEVKGKRFLSIEPQLLDIDFYKVADTWNGKEINPWRKGPDAIILNGINWVIQGGESGPNRRPFELEWAYNMKEQCDNANVPYFFKQIDKVKQVPDDLIASREIPTFSL